MRIFGDAFDDIIFSKKVKRFTPEEKTLIDRFINTILREDKISELEISEIKSFNDRADGITEEIFKQFIFKGTIFYLRFCKFFNNEMKDDLYLRSDLYSFRGLITDGYNSTRVPIDEDNFLKDFKDEKSITGIFVHGLANVPKSNGLDTLFFSGKLREKNEYDVRHAQEVLGIRTKYQDVRNGGDTLTNECKTHIDSVHLQIIRNAILKKIV